MYIPNNPTSKENSKKKGDIEIVRLSPGNQRIKICYKCRETNTPKIKLVISNLETGAVVYEEVRYNSALPFDVKGLLNEIVYVAEILVLDKNDKELFRSGARLFETGFFPGEVLEYIHPGDMTYIHSGEFLGSPFILKLDNGQYLASHDIFIHDRTGTGTLCRFYTSNNYGKDWNYVSSVEECTWGSLFKHNGKVYIIGTRKIFGGGDLVLYCSEDDGNSWNGPIVIGKADPDSDFRAAPTAHVEANGRIWFYCGIMNYKSNTGMRVLTVSGDLSCDLSEPDSWIVSDDTAYDEAWDGAVKRWNDVIMEEGNMVVAPDGELKMIVRCNSHRYDIPETNPDNIYAIHFKLDKNNPKAAPEFECTSLFNGALHKFYIQYDEVSGKYYALVNRITTNHIWQRDVLSLVSSEDLYKWDYERDLINLEDIAWHESDWDCGVQYPTFFIDGDDIVAAVRTAMNNADNFHNSNAITIHRFKHFRDKYRY